MVLRVILAPIVSPVTSEHVYWAVSATSGAVKKARAGDFANSYTNRSGMPVTLRSWVTKKLRSNVSRLGLPVLQAAYIRQLSFGAAVDRLYLLRITVDVTDITDHCCCWCDSQDTMTLDEIGSSCTSWVLTSKNSDLTDDIN
jgi:hypothetical protein